ncbi:MAG: hypothetical protein UV09_C0017G0017 [Candidatus Gottesmanbacteria bacterium GW2011_GWA2_42_18]|uniref:SCP domain-containing protein n=2 Tax=Candidatus Gottesmaniibacteriota TaxID=1752720 RepID=A0A0G0ZCN1_9BACT|nr:MAG: hypothetical protein UV09_C0017G0017 [Candidatus Gottesmanbacteria bacterium GW2011_GWA2_42_18]
MLMLSKLRHFFAHYFFPNYSNNYRAKTLHRPSLLIYILFLLVIQSAYLQIRSMNPNILGFATDITHEKILYLVNLERQKSGLDPLSYSIELATAASQKAQDMFLKNYWAHISPTGATPWEFIVRNGYQYIYAGENLAKSFNTSEEVVAAWMNSPTHRANIMKEEYTEIGIGIANGSLNGEETTLVVQEFGSRGRTLTATDTPDRTFTAEVIPTTMPVPAIAYKEAKTAVNANKKLPKMLSIVIAEFMLVILMIDSLFIWRHKTIRLGSHSLAHILFFLTLLGAMSATGIGAIL